MASGQVYVRQGEQGEQRAMMESNKVTRLQGQDDCNGSKWYIADWSKHGKTMQDLKPNHAKSMKLEISAKRFGEV